MAWLARMRTGHVSLNKYLHGVSNAESPQCECGDGVETVSHYLLRCMNYDEQREILRKEVGFGSMRIGKLLGDPKLIRFTVEYMENTERFTF
jgi:hypothetical protein